MYMKSIVLALLLLTYCSEEPIGNYNKPLQIQVTVSDTHKQTLDIKHSLYKNNKVDLVFDAFKNNTKDICNPKLTLREDLNWVVSSLMAGCLNFFLINDMAASKAFTQLNEITKGQNNDCYTVGFSQLYLMYTYSNCKSISSIDIDWRIHHAHYQFLRRINNKELIEDALSKIELGQPNKGLYSFCEYQNIARCIVAFEYFANNFKTINNIYFQIKFLHEAEFYKTNSDNILVYVSNAIDPEYTTKKQFDLLIKNIAKAITNSNQKAYIIYHTGGADIYAIYKLFVVNNEPYYYAVCRDNLRWAKSYGKMAGIEYKTYLDDGKEYPACSI